MTLSHISVESTNGWNILHIKDSQIYSIPHTQRRNVHASVREMSLFSWWWDALVCIPHYHNGRVSFFVSCCCYFNWLSAIFLDCICVSHNSNHLEFNPCRCRPFSFRKCFPTQFSSVGVNSVHVQFIMEILVSTRTNSNENFKTKNGFNQLMIWIGNDDKIKMIGEI